MADVTQTIGTASRDWSTIAAWEAQLDNATYYSAADNAIGECYNDAAFTEATVVIDGGGTIGLTSVTLHPATGEFHDGTAGTGVRMVKAATRARCVQVKGAAGVDYIVDGIEFDGNGKSQTHDDVVLMGTESTGQFASGDIARLSRSLIHGDNASNGEHRGVYINLFGASGSECHVLDCVIYDIAKASGTGSDGAYAINDTTTTPARKILNVTCNDITGFGTGTTYGIRFVVDGALATVKNCVCIDCNQGANTGTKSDYGVTDTTNKDFNASSDTSAPGATVVTSITAANNFADPTGPPPDFNTKDASAGIYDAGTDLVTTPTGVNISITGRDRDASGDTWDMGAGEFVAAAGGGGIWEIGPAGQVSSGGGAGSFYWEIGPAA